MAEKNLFLLLFNKLFTENDIEMCSTLVICHAIISVQIK